MKENYKNRIWLLHIKQISIYKRSYSSIICIKNNCKVKIPELLVIFILIISINSWGNWNMGIENQFFLIIQTLDLLKGFHPLIKATIYKNKWVKLNRNLKPILSAVILLILIIKNYTKKNTVKIRSFKEM